MDISSYFTKKHLTGYTLAVLATIGFSFAFLLYRNGMMNENGDFPFPVSASLFWFSLFACATSLLISSFTPILNRKAVQKKGKADPRQTFAASLRIIFKEKIFILIPLDAVLFTGQFALTLHLLIQKNDSAVLMIVLIGLLRPILITMGSAIFVGEKPDRWDLFILGTLLTILGIILFKASGSISFDWILLLYLFFVLVSSSQTIVQGKYRRKYKIYAVHPMSVALIGCTLISLLWMLSESGGAIVFPTNKPMWVCLFLLGLFPTGLCKIMQVIAEDLTSMQNVSIISSLTAFFVIIDHHVFSKLSALGYKYAYLLTLEKDPENGIIGIIIAVIGAIIIVFTKKDKSQAENEQKTSP